VRKTALGTDRFLEFTAADQAVDAVNEAHEKGWRVIALELTDDAQPLHAVAVGDPVCIVVGNEDHGISAAALRACNAIAYLPQLGKVGSLNVAVAASIALYEARRQEWEP
jgi:tRNA (guanosine-2'-O-)-methyltransferase